MSNRYRVAVIGCGRPYGTEGSTGFGMSHMHVHGYQETGRCDLVAIADVSRENAEAFAARWGECDRTGRGGGGAYAHSEPTHSAGRHDPGADLPLVPPPPAIYLDHRAMLAEARPEIVSICTWSHLHAEMVIACAEAGIRAVHCEKPMATTWGDARRMAAACEQSGTQLTINHQNRFRAPYRVARDLARGGAIGELRRLEGTSSDLTNSHWLDMLFFYNEETPAEWVIGQIDSRSERKSAGVPREDQGICYLKFANGVRALLLTGSDAEIGCTNRLIGTEGCIEVHGKAPRVRVHGKGDAAWQLIEVPDEPDWQPAIDQAIADVVAALDEGRESELSARRALQTTEVIFATYASSRRRGRVDLPLTLEELPLLTCDRAGSRSVS